MLYSVLVLDKSFISVIVHNVMISIILKRRSMDHALRMKLQDHGNKQSEDLKIEDLSKYIIREVICTIREVKDSISSAIRDVKRNTLPFDISSHSRCQRESSTIRDLKLFDKSIIRDLKPFDISD